MCADFALTRYLHFWDSYEREMQKKKKDVQQKETRICIEAVSAHTHTQNKKQPTYTATWIGKVYYSRYVG